MYKVKISGIARNSKVVWDIIEAYQGSVKEPTEWVGTKIVWELTEVKDGTEVYFSHLGLAPALECFAQCTGGWDYLINKSLAPFLDTGKGLPV